jgi:hypothetical protein
MERETLYNWVIIGLVIALCFGLFYVFVIIPFNQKTLQEQNFDKERGIFIDRFCTNLGFQKYKVEDISDTVYNMYCYTQESENVRVASYFRYDYDQRDGKYYFYIVKEKKL